MKINKSAALASLGPNAPPPAAAPQPEAAPAAPAAPQLPATVQSPQDFMAMVTQEEEGDAVASERSLPPYLAFLHGMQNAAVRAAVASTLGSVPDGAPYIFASPSTVYNARELHFVRLKPLPFRYWSLDDSDGREERISEVRPTDGRWKERARGLFLAIGAGIPGGAMTVTYSVKQATISVSTSLHDAVAASKTPEWVKQHGGTLGNVPPDFRVCGQLQVSQRQVRSGDNKGKNYTQAGLICKPTPVAVLEALHAWTKRPEAQAEYAIARAYHERTVARLRELA